MRVFVTGASGHIGSAVVPELLQAGHQVVGLARNDAAAERIAARGAEVHRGDVFDPDTYLDAVAAADGVIHLAYDHSFTDMAEAAAKDLRAVQAIGEKLAGTGKPLVTTAGTLMLAMGVPGDVGLEQHTLPGGPRVDTENAVIALAERGVRSSVVRLAPLVHSDLDHHGFAPVLIRIAREKGVAGYVGDGANRWPALNTRDAARIYRLAAGDGAGRHPPARRRERGLRLPRDRRDHRQAARRPDGVDPRRGGGRALRLPRRARRAGQPHLERGHPQDPRLGAGARGPDRGPGAGPLLRRAVSPGELCAKSRTRQAPAPTPPSKRQGRCRPLSP